MTHVASLDTTLLEGETMNIGRFLETLQNGGELMEKNPCFASSINSKLCAFADIATVTTCEGYNQGASVTQHKMTITPGIVDYMTEKWNMRLDFVHNYTGAIPQKMYGLKPTPCGGIAGWGELHAPSTYDIFAVLYNGEMVNPDGGKMDVYKRLQEQGRMIFPDMSDAQRAVFSRPDVYVEIDKNDTSPQALWARAAFFDKFQQEVVWKKRAVKDVFPNLKFYGGMEEDMLCNGLGIALFPEIMRGGPYYRFMLAPESSFKHGKPLRSWLMESEALVRERLTGEWRFREREKRLHKKDGNKSRSVERLANNSVIKRKPAKDPVLLQLTRRGFAVLAAWSNETDEIYHAGEVLRLI